MKRIFRRVVLSCSVLLALPLLLVVASQVASFAFFYVSLSHLDTDACSHYYEGMSKGTIWASGEWHHYVDFKVDSSDSIHDLKITDSPLPASFWWGYSGSSITTRYIQMAFQLDGPVPSERLEDLPCKFLTQRNPPAV